MKKIRRKYTFQDGYEFMSSLPKSYKLIEDNTAPYRFVWLDEFDKKIVTYCEGDVTVCSFDTEAELQVEVKAIRKYYKITADLKRGGEKEL